MSLLMLEEDSMPKTKEEKNKEANERKTRYDRLTIDEKLGACPEGSKQYLRLIKEKEEQNGDK